MDLKGVPNASAAMEKLGNPRYRTVPMLYRVEDGGVFEVPDQKVILDFGSLPVGRASDRYGIYQPVHMLEMAYDIASTTGGHVKNFHFGRGNSIATIEVGFPGSVNIGKRGVDPVDVGGRLYNSFDGTGSARFEVTMWRKVCSNGMYGLRKEARACVRHTHSVYNRMEEAIRAAGYIQNKLPALIENLSRLTEVGVTPSQKREFIERLIPGEGTRSERIRGAISTWEESGPGSKIYPNTAWNLYNGVTAYVTHELAVGRNGRDRARLGAGVTLEERALELLKEMK